MLPPKDRKRPLLGSEFGARALPCTERRSTLRLSKLPMPRAGARKAMNVASEARDVRWSCNARRRDKVQNQFNIGGAAPIP